MVPLAGAPGSVAVLTTPDAVDADRATRKPVPDLASNGRRTIHTATRPLPDRHETSRTFVCPLLVLVCDDDQSAPAGSAVRAHKNAPNCELARMPGGHYEPFLDGHEHAVAVQLEFLERRLTRGTAAPAAPASPVCTRVTRVTRVHPRHPRPATVAS